jgi:hypothetical protein
MATVTSPQKANGQASEPMSLSRKIRYGIYAVLALMALWLIFNFSFIKGQAKLGASYAAHVACSCRYIQGRPLDACYKDFEPGMGLVSLTDDPKHQRVTASVPVLASAVAERRGDFGCLQLNAREIEAVD